MPCIQRCLFPIVSGQTTYRIGPGGEFNIPQRPVTINAAGLLLAPGMPTFAVTGVTGSSFTVAGNQVGSLPSGSSLIVSGATGNNGPYTIVAAVYGSSTTITVAQTVPSAVADGTLTVFVETSGTVEIPIAVNTDASYQANQVKTLLNTQWTQLWFNPTYANGLATIWLWPAPNTAANGCVLYLDQHISGFASLAAQYWFPPGYADLFEYTLAKRLWAVYPHPDQGTLTLILQECQRAEALVRRTNFRLVDMPSEAGLINQPGSLYNILVGNG